MSFPEIGSDDISSRESALTEGSQETFQVTLRDESIIVLVDEL